MKRILSLLCCLLLWVGGSAVQAQSKTTQAFHKDHEDAFTLFFYNNTLKMLNATENEAFNELVDDIDKMKLLRIDKSAAAFSKEDYKQLIKDYQKESFESLMNVKQKDMRFDVYIKEKDNITEGLVVLIDEGTNLSILDIKGAVPLDRLAELFETVSKIRN